MNAVRLIVGLGNPGERYVASRHNCGYWFLQNLARAPFTSDSAAQAHSTTLFLHHIKLRLLRPDTFMNRSGKVVADALHYYKLAPTQLLLAHDELDLPPGIARLKFGGGHGGHNGVRDTMQHLASGDFLRLRLGIGHPGKGQQVDNYVLQPPKQEDKAKIDQAIGAAVDCLPYLLQGEIQRAINQLHATAYGG